MKRSVVVTIAASMVVAVVVVTLLRVSREREWTQGGDHVSAEAEVALSTAEGFAAEAARLGVPPQNRFLSAGQVVVVRVRWSGVTEADGYFSLIALDSRVEAPWPLAAQGGWNADGITGTSWGSAYDELAKHYDWLGGTARTTVTDASGRTSFQPAAAVDARATETGTVTAWFRQWHDKSAPFTEPSREIAVALVYIDESGDVRWARRIFG